MKKTTYVHTTVVVLLLLTGLGINAQTYKPFTPRKNVDVKGSMLVIGNSILGQNNQDFNDFSLDNQDINMQYIDIDGDASTFSSSSAELQLQPQEDGSPTICYRVVYAALYWGAVLQSGDRSDINKIKFKLPGASSYTNITGEIIYDAVIDPIIAEDDEPGNTPYACYAEVTDLLTELSDVEGNYTLANVTSGLGSNFSTGLSAGWSLVIIYEDPNLHTKSFTTYDGFSHIYNDHYEEVPVTGFTTPPAGHIDLQFAYGTLDGDRTKRATKLEINGKEVTTPLRPANKFFGSVIENYNGISHPRNPFSANTLGYDTGFLEIINSEPEYIKNNVSNASFTLQVARGQADPIFAFWAAFAVDIIAPDIELTKIVLDEDGNNIDGGDVVMGQRVFYEITYQSVGNDNVSEFTIKDILPENIIFDPATDIDLSNAGGATLESYDPATRTIIFSIPDGSVQINDPSFVIRLAVRVVPNCEDLTQACSNEIMNQAYATYRGKLNPEVIEEEGSFATIECLNEPAPTNFLINLSNCNFEKTEVLCGDSIELKASDGYDSYSWSASSTGSPVISTDQNYTATATGTYYVTSTINSNCISIEEVFNVITYGSGVTNPVIPYADLLPTCPNDGKVLPYIFLCGANDQREILTGISEAVSITWQKLDEASCPAVTVDDCANEDGSCVWNQVSSGQNFTADTAGQFRVVINFPGGCFSEFYFNVYQNLLAPTVSARDILCTSPGRITVGNVPSGYEYSLEPNGPYQASNVFTVNASGYYKVFIRQTEADINPCIFETPEVFIRSRDFSVASTILQPDCYEEKGSILIAANDALPQYYFQIYEGGTLVNSVGPIQESDYTFKDLNSGNYTVEVSTDDGCVYTENIEIAEPPILSVTAALTLPLTCIDGEITIFPEGGTSPYTYFINSTTVSQDNPEYAVTAPGTYNITVYDFNGCSASTSIAVGEILRPEFTLDSTDLSCPDSDDGTITINVTNANGNSIMYSIDNGATFVDSNVFAGLSPGDYEVIVQYTTGPEPCNTVPESITVNGPDPITGSATLTAPYTCIGDATITVTDVTGGTAPYQYSLDGINYQPSNTFNGLTPGTYKVAIKDANDCTINTETITIDPLDPPTAMAFDLSELSCPANTSIVTITGVTGGVAPFEYQIVAPSTAATGYQSSNTFNGLSPDTYTFQVRDANNCTYIESASILPLPPLTVDVVLTKDLDCSASVDAIITGEINGSFSPFNVALVQGTGTATASGNTFTLNTPNSGNYQFQITDDKGCTVLSSVITVTDPVVISANNSSMNPTCNGFSDGSITLSTTNGQAPFNYSLDGGATFVTTNVFGGLTANDYDYVIVDANGCNVAGIINLNDPLPMDVSFVSNPIQCNPDIPGSIEMTINLGGVAPFTYTLYDDMFAQVGSSANTSSTSNTFSGLGFGDYFITIVDAKGCEFSSPAIRIETPPNLGLVSNASSGTCVDGANVEIEVVTGVGPFTYAIYGQPATSFGPTASTTHTFSGLNHGVTYQFQVIDGGGCFSLLEVTTPTISSMVIEELSTTDIVCEGDTDGTLNFTVSNYDPATTSIYFEVQDQLSNTPIVPAKNGTFTGLSGSPATGAITALPAGNYNLFIMEVDGALCTVSTPFQINPPVQPLLSVVAAVENANCIDDAQLTITTTGGTGPYEYAVGTPGFNPLDTEFDSNNVIYLDYAIGSDWDIVVRDAKGCEVRINETINIDPEPIIEANFTDQCLDVDGNFEIEVNLTSPGVSPYTFSIDGGAFQAMSLPFKLANLSSGSHSIEVRDANGCDNLVTVDIFPPINLLANASALPSCNNDDGEISLDPNGGSGSYDFTISPNPASISLSGNIFSGMPAGSYTITMTDTASLCTDTVEIILPEAEPLTFTTLPNEVSCYGDNSGSFEIDIINYSGPYTFEVFDSTNSSVSGIVMADTTTNPLLVSGMIAGTYTVNIIETAYPFCSSTETVIISSPFEAINLELTETSNVSCDGNRGTIVSISSGGAGGFEYQLSGASSVPYSRNGTFAGLSAGDYTVNVRDAEGCIATENISLIGPPAINAMVEANDNLLPCFGDTNATITVSNITGGQGGNYTFTLQTLSPVASSSGPQNSPTFGGLGSGTYRVDVTDGFNCTFTSTDIVIAEPTPVSTDLRMDSSQTCLVDASLTLTANGGTGPYEYSSEESFSTVLGSFADTVIFSVSPGSYVFYVRDANECVSLASNQIGVEELQPFIVNLDTTNSKINCSGDSTGVIVASAQGGLGHYSYTLQDGQGNDIVDAIQNDPGIFTELPAGDYLVSVSSGDCEATSIPVTISEPSSPLLIDFTTSNITCSGDDDGIITIDASGGTGIIKYAISPQLDQFFAEPIFDNLPSGTYEIIVQDELGCYQIIEATIEEPEPVMISIVADSMIPEICEGDLNGEFDINISGGSLPYSVSLDNYEGPYTTGIDTQTQFDFTELNGGDHTVFVRDAQGCESEWNITFPESVSFDAGLAIDYCTDASDASSNLVTIAIESSSVDLSEIDYALNNGPFQPENTFADLIAGKYVVTIRHTNGCEKSLDFEIEQYDPLELSVSDGNVNEIMATTTGGSGVYTYELQFESETTTEPYGDTNTFVIYESGNYTIHVTDSNGCTAVATGYFEHVDVCITNYFTPNNDGVQDGWGPGCTQQFQNLTFDIFDRYGRAVASLRAGEKWNGKYNGKELPTGDYWYVVHLNDQRDRRDFVGHFTLYR